MAEAQSHQRDPVLPLSSSSEVRQGSGSSGAGVSTDTTFPPGGHTTQEHGSVRIVDPPQPPRDLSEPGDRDVAGEMGETPLFAGSGTGSGTGTGAWGHTREYGQLGHGHGQAGSGSRPTSSGTVSGSAAGGAGGRKIPSAAHALPPLPVLSQQTQPTPVQRAVSVGGSRPRTAEQELEQLPDYQTQSQRGNGQGRHLGDGNERIGGNIPNAGSSAGGDPGRGGQPPNLNWRNSAITPIPQSYAKTIEDRLKPTLDLAKSQAAGYERTTRIASLTVNIALGLQVVIGALITGIAAAAGPKRARIGTTILGGASTIVACILARTRGIGEPELSEERARDLQKFIRACEATVLDWGHERPDPLALPPFPKHVELLKTIDQYREWYDGLIRAWNGEKNSPETLEQRDHDFKGRKG